MSIEITAIRSIDRNHFTMSFRQQQLQVAEMRILVLWYDQKLVSET